MDDVLTMIEDYERILELPELTALWLVMFTDGGGMLVDSQYNENLYEYYKFDTLDELKAFLKQEIEKDKDRPTQQDYTAMLNEVDGHAYARIVKVLAQANLTISAYQYRSLREVMHDLMTTTITVSGGSRKPWKKRAE